MAKSEQTSESNKKPISKFEELLGKPIQINKDRNDKYKNYYDYVKSLYYEWMLWRYLYEKLIKKWYSSFLTLKKNMPELNPLLPPQFFTGNIESSVVVISLNGHAGDQSSEIDATQYCKTWAEYKDFWTNFVTKRYKDYKIDPNTEKERSVSRFDEKLHHFIIGKKVEVNSEVLAKWKLFHIELCPFLSSSYSSSCKLDELKPYLLRALDAIALKKRKLILVLNREVCKILDSLPCIDDYQKNVIQESDEIWVRVRPKKRSKNQYPKENMCNWRKNMTPMKINYKIQRMIRKGKSFKASTKKLDTFTITALPTFAHHYMDNDYLEKYNHFALTGKERFILKMAIRGK